MFTAEFILAAALLTQPIPDVSSPVFQVHRNAKGVATVTTISDPGEPDVYTLLLLRPQILAIALDLQILDVREKGFVMGQDVLGDFQMLKGRYHDFLKAPKLEEAQRFPDRKYVQELLATNRAYRTYLEKRLAIDLIHAEEIRITIQETDLLYQVWDCVRDAHCDYYYTTVRRQSLSLLRDLIGDEWFYSGRMPPHVPVWRMQRR